MATLIRIKRSGTYTSGSPAVAQGELAYTYAQANNPANGQGHKLFIGTGTETNGIAATTEVIGGSYFTDMMDHVAGVTTASSALIVDSNKRLDDFYVDNIQINSNIISTTDTDTDLILRPDGTGAVVLEDDNALEFGSSADVSVSWNNAGNKLQVTGGDIEFGNTVALTLLDNTASTTTTSGALIVTGGVGIGGNLNVGGNLTVTGTQTFTDDLAVNGGDITTTSTTFNLLNATATTVNAFGAATTLEIGAATGTTNINNNLDVDGDVNIDGGDLTVSTTTFNLANTTATTVNAFGAATTLTIGAATGTATIKNADVVLDGDLQVNGGDLATTQSTFNLLTTTATTVNAFSAATTLNVGAATGTTNIKNNLDVDGDVNIDGGDLTVSTTTFNLANSTATTVNAFGAATTVNLGTASTLLDLGALNIQGTTISTESGSQTITLDPYPAAGDSGGEVIVRGNLTVTGLTTTVNSTAVSVNDPIFTLGDSISEKTLTSSAANGATVLTLDNTTGINAGDIVSGSANIPNGTKISSVDSSTQITIDTALTGGISSGTALTFTLAMNDALDRGIEFKYYSGSLKTGFFGYDESTTFFTFIPNATNTSNTFSGSVGDAYFNTVKYEIGVNKGVAFYDTNKKLTTTVAAGTSDATTSYQILTTDSGGTPVWTTTLDGGTF